jgi:hypothetical protein
LDNEEQEDKEKRTPAETRHNGSGSLFIHFSVLDLVDLDVFPVSPMDASHSEGNCAAARVAVQRTSKIFSAGHFSDSSAEIG